MYSCRSGEKPIPNGPVAIVLDRVPPEIRQMAGKVRVGKAMGVSANLKGIDIEGVQAAIVVK